MEKVSKENKFKAIGISRLRMGSDGEGVTTLVAAYGCPLRCKYCLNPMCFQPNYKTEEYAVESLIDEVVIDDLYFKATGGGIVFGGGEPLLFADFIHEFRQKCPPEWKISLETSLSVPQSQLEKIITDIDFFLVDCKDMNPEIYKKYTGKSQDEFLSNLIYLRDKKLQEKVTVRIPLIPEYNTEANQQASIRTLEELGFSNFDTFCYNVEVASRKAESLKAKTKARVDKSK